jgi:phosphoglycolate phosphatase
MERKYNAIIFDFDFTLADASEGIEHCLKYGFEQMDIEFVSPGMEIYTSGITLKELISSHTGSTDAKFLEEVYAQYLVVAKDNMTEMTRLFDDTHDALIHLKNEGYELGIVSNKYRYRIEEYLERNNYRDFFEVIVGMEDMAEPKPAPEGLLLAMERIGTTIDKTLFIGDNPVDAETARRAGTDFIGISRFGHKHFENSDHEFLALIKSLEELKSHL